MQKRLSLRVLYPIENLARRISLKGGVQSEIWEFVKVSTGFVQSEGLSQQQRGRTMGPLAAQQKPKLWQLNYFTDKALLEGPGPRRPEKEMRGVLRAKTEEIVRDQTHN